MGIKTGRMHRSRKILPTVLLLLVAGGHLSVLQSVAWTTMLLNNLSRAPLTEAIKRTFDGSRPCAMCKAIAAQKEAGKKVNYAKDVLKLEFPPAAKARIPKASEPFQMTSLASDFAHPLTPQPPTPPPPRGPMA